MAEERTVWLSVGLTADEWDEATGWLTEAIGDPEWDKGGVLLGRALEAAMRKAGVEV